MRRSHAEAQATRTKILDAAMLLMLEKGYIATTVDEICQKSAVTKGSLFHHFESKEELGKAVLYHFWSPIRQGMAQGPYQALADPLERLYAYCDFIADLYEHPQTPESCLFGNLTQELWESHPQIITVCDAAFTWWAEVIQADVEAAKKLYAPELNMDAQHIAELFVVIFEGAIILVKAHHNRSLMRQHLSHYKRYLTMLFANKL